MSTNFYVAGGVDGQGRLFIDLLLPNGQKIRIDESSAIALDRSLSHILKNAHTIPGYVKTGTNPLVYEEIHGVMLGEG